MKILVLYDYPAPPGGLATQGDLLYRGLLEMGVEAHAAHLESALEKRWYYRWFKPDAVIGVGYWGHVPQLVLHPLSHGARPVPWLLADGYVANYHEALNALPLILVTSEWVKERFMRDGIKGDNIEVLPVGCDTDSYRPRDLSDPRVAMVRDLLGVRKGQLMILTVGGDAASKGGREVMEALHAIRNEVPDFRYVCKVYAQPRTTVQNHLDAELAKSLGLRRHVIYSSSRVSREFMPYLLSACDVYAAPSRLEGFGMVQVEANACSRPVLGIKAMGMLDTLVHEETALLADVGQEIRVKEMVMGSESGFEPGHVVTFDPPRTIDYRASVPSVAIYLKRLMTDPELRKRMGEAGRKRVVERFDYRVVARRLVEILGRRLGIG
jgi:glycosyltransferase involved in cell wall biosynthesis